MPIYNDGIATTVVMGHGDVGIGWKVSGDVNALHLGVIPAGEVGRKIQSGVLTTRDYPVRVRFLFGGLADLDCLVEALTRLREEMKSQEVSRAREEEDQGPHDGRPRHEVYVLPPDPGG